MSHKKKPKHKEAMKQKEHEKMSCGAVKMPKGMKMEKKK